ncbi:MAG: YgeY family selenium metabolism-linked hydrolase [Desulfobacterales bacterium]|nr:YgeY family selenium metabolism-linked hydrolase [Desulfobacterales bacterium]
MNAISSILDLSRRYRDDTAAALSELVKIPSLSCREKEVAAKLAGQMRAAGFDEVTIDGLGNVIGRIGRGSRILAFDGHIDTVDVGNPANWNEDPFSGAIRDGFVYGRGAADQKGGPAAMVTAGRILKEIGFDRDLTLYFVGSVMEEDCDGLCWKYIIEEDGIRPEAVVITEPTDGGLYRGQRGRMEIEVEFRGVSAHGSAPERGKNAIYMASRACLAAERLNEGLAVDEFLGKGSVALSQFVSGSPSLCAVADYARIHLDRRLTWGETRESALAEIEALVQGEEARVFLLDYEEAAYTGRRYGMEKYYPTWKWPEEHPSVAAGARAYNALFGRRPRIGKWTFSTNAVTISGIYGIPAVGFGPGAEAMAHAPNEKTPVEELVNAAAFYAAYAISF